MCLSLKWCMADSWRASISRVTKCQSSRTQTHHPSSADWIIIDSLSGVSRPTSFGAEFSSFPHWFQPNLNSLLFPINRLRHHFQINQMGMIRNHQWSIISRCSQQVVWRSVFSNEFPYKGGGLNTMFSPFSNETGAVALLFSSPATNRRRRYKELFGWPIVISFLYQQHSACCCMCLFR